MKLERESRRLRGKSEQWFPQFTWLSCQTTLIDKWKTKHQFELDFDLQVSPS
jgi:hypothetical protein